MRVKTHTTHTQTNKQYSLNRLVKAGLTN